MKAKKKAKTSNSVNVTPAISAQAAKQHFAQIAQKSKDGANTYLEKLLSVLDTVMTFKSAFTLDDVIYYAQPYEIPALEIKRLFEKWVSTMESLNKITVVSGCYDSDLVCLV